MDSTQTTFAHPPTPGLFIDMPLFYSHKILWYITNDMFFRKRTGVFNGLLVFWQMNAFKNIYAQSEHKDANATQSKSRLRLDRKNVV